MFLSSPRQIQTTKNRAFSASLRCCNGIPACCHPCSLDDLSSSEADYSLCYLFLLNWRYFANVLTEKPEIAADLLGRGWFMPFVVLYIFGINFIIILIEVLVLNSIKFQEVCIAARIILQPKCDVANLGTHYGSHNDFTCLCWLGICRKNHHRKLSIILPQPPKDRLGVYLAAVVSLVGLVNTCGFLFHASW